MERKSNSGKEEKKADASKSGEGMSKGKAKGKKPMDSEIIQTMDESMEEIIQQARRVSIGGSEIPKNETDTVIDTAAKSKGKAVATASGAGSGRSTGKQVESISRGRYELRSSGKASIIDLEATKKAGDKRKASEKRRDFLVFRQPFQKIKREPKNDEDRDDTDETGTGIAARTTRSSTRGGK